MSLRPSYRGASGIPWNDRAAWDALFAADEDDYPLPKGHEPVRAGKCFVCGRPSDNDLECLGCERGGR